MVTTADDTCIEDADADSGDLDNHSRDADDNGGNDGNEGRAG